MIWVGAVCVGGKLVGGGLLGVGSVPGLVVVRIGSVRVGMTGGGGNGIAGGEPPAPSSSSGEESIVIVPVGAVDEGTGATMMGLVNLIESDTSREVPPG